jgi:regulator of replication initiation timing
MGVIETVKDIGVLVQKLDNMDLVKRLVELQEQVYDVVTENRDLKEQNRTLQETLTTREQLTFRKNSYWNGQEGPFCSRCWDADGQLVRLHTQQGFYPRCPKCDHVAADPDQPPPRPSQRAITSSYLRRDGY